MNKKYYTYHRKLIDKRFLVIVTALTVTIVTVGNYSVNKGIIKFAQGQPVGNIVSTIDSNGITLKSLAEVQEIKESIIFVDEAEVTDMLDDFYSEAPIDLMSFALADVEPVNEIANEMLSNVSGEELENDILKQYGLSSDYKVTLGDEVGVGSEVRKLTTPGTHTDTDSTLLEVRKAAMHVDENYEGHVVTLTSRNRDLVERLVQGESGAEGFIGAALVAQTIRDTMLYDNEFDLMTIKRAHAYSGALNTAPNQTVKDAVAFIFDNGGYIVQHRLIYFYSPKNMKNGVSKFHETQKFIIHHGGHKFFDMVDAD